MPIQVKSSIASRRHPMHHGKHFIGDYCQQELESFEVCRENVRSAGSGTGVWTALMGRALSHATRAQCAGQMLPSCLMEGQQMLFLYLVRAVLAAECRLSRLLQLVAHQHLSHSRSGVNLLGGVFLIPHPPPPPLPPSFTLPPDPTSALLST